MDVFGYLVPTKGLYSLRAKGTFGERSCFSIEKQMRFFILPSTNKRFVFMASLGVYSRDTFGHPMKARTELFSNWETAPLADRRIGAFVTQ